MIENDEQLKQTRLALNHLESALSALKRDVLPLNPARFALMAEPVVDHIREHEVTSKNSSAFAAHYRRSKCSTGLPMKTPRLESNLWARSRIISSR